MKVPTYTNAVPPRSIRLDELPSFDTDFQHTGTVEYFDTRTSAYQDLQNQISLLNQRIEALEELLLEFGIKKVFDKADNQE